jgi:predicted RNase H-like HicB family nuclease
MNADLVKKAEELSAELYATETMRDITTTGELVYLLSHPELPGCMAQGRTIKEAQDNLVDARREYILSLLEDGEPVPLPKIMLTVTSAGQSSIDLWGYVGQPQQTFPDDLPDVVQPKRGSHLGTVSPVVIG